MDDYENHATTSLDDDDDDDNNLDTDSNAGEGRGLMEGASITFDNNSVLPVDSASASKSATTRKKNGDSLENKDEKLKRRMETNRLRAKDIRKRKKRMIEEMHNQIFQLTLENNKLRTQTEVQQTQIDILRQSLANVTGDVLTTEGNSNKLQPQQQQLQQQQVRPHH